MFHIKTVDDIRNNTVCFWSWNNDLKEEELIEQLKGFAERNIGVIIHARAGLRVPYMESRWFELMQSVLAVAEKLNVEVYLYDEDGWPSGFAGGKVALQDPSCSYKKLCFGYGEKKREYIAIYNKVSDSEWKIADLADLNEDSLCFWYEEDSHYVDLLDDTATDLFLQFTHDTYKRYTGKYFGKVIKGIFTDEPQLNVDGYSWNKSIPEWFEQKYSENVFENLWRLSEDDEAAGNFKQKWWQLISERYATAFVKKLSAWCEENGIALTGHFAMEDGISNQIASCGGVMSHYEYMQLPGIDHLGNRVTSPVLKKQVASVSNQLGNGRVLSETFGCSGWNISQERLEWVWGSQLVFGINKPCLHLSAYSLEGRRKRDYPPMFSYQSNWWKVLGVFTERINSMNDFMSEGNRLCDTLVINPITEARRLYTHSSGNRTKLGNLSNEYRQLLENMLSLQWDFELGDEKLIKKYASIKEGKVILGRCSYSTVVIPRIDNLLPSTWELLKDFQNNGGRIIFIDSLPSSTPKGISRYSVIQNSRRVLEKYLAYEHFERKIVITDPSGRNICDGLVLHVRNVDGNLRLQIWNSSWYDRKKAVLCVEGKFNASVVNFPDLKTTSLQSEYDINGNTKVALDIPAGANLFIELNQNEEEISAEYDFVSCEKIADIDCELSDKNCLTVDFASYRLGKGDWSEKLPIVHIADRINKNNSSKTVEIKYCFNISKELLDTDDITIAAETRSAEDISLNGVSISDRCIGWWMDKAINEYSTKGLITQGKNEIVIRYIIEKTGNILNVDEIFETERNRFFYNIEPESVYIRGNFDVCTEKYTHSFDYYEIESDDFVIKPQTPNIIGDITKQNNWFYVGDIKYSFKLSKIWENSKVFISLDNMRGFMAELKINSKSGYLISREEKADITNALCEGENTVEVTLIGTNRNCLGPHHHINGENIFVGPSNFNGKIGFEDFVSPHIKNSDTWKDRYSFVEFGIDAVKIEYYNKKSGDI